MNKTNTHIALHTVHKMAKTLQIQPPNNAMFSNYPPNSNSFTRPWGVFLCFGPVGLLSEEFKTRTSSDRNRKSAQQRPYVLSPLSSVTNSNSDEKHVRLVWSERAGPFPAISFQVLNTFSLCATYYIEELQ